MQCTDCLSIAQSRRGAACITGQRLAHLHMVQQAGHALHVGDWQGHCLCRLPASEGAVQPWHGVTEGEEAGVHYCTEGVARRDGGGVRNGEVIHEDLIELAGAIRMQNALLSEMLDVLAEGALWRAARRRRSEG